MQLDQIVHQEFRLHALEEYPKEACGLVVNNKYIKCRNVAVDPLKDFEIDSNDLMHAESLGPIQAVLHSHPYELAGRGKWDPVWPSTADMECWLEDDVPWGIASTDGKGISELVWLDDSEHAPLEGRLFIHGIHDCYAIVRDYFKEQGIILNNYARGIEWWVNGKDLYSENFAKEGFYEIQESEATVGDCCLFKVHSPVINHAAVITGEDEILHHLFHRLSYKDSLRKWKRQIVKYVRYKDPNK